LADIIKHGLHESLKRLYCADAFFDGDISFAGKRSANDALAYLPVYDYMFNRDNDIFVGEQERFHKDGEPHFSNLIFTRDPKEIIRFKRKMKEKTLSQLYVVTSFIGTKQKRKPIRDDWRIVHAAATNVIDLGDSRNFKDVDECIEKIKLIETSICYVGSLCGWYDISRLYDKPTIILASDIEAYKKSALGFSLGEGQYMYTPDDHLTW